MRCKLNRTRLSGSGATIYTIQVNGEDLFDRFLKENKPSFSSEVKDIVARLIFIGKHGAKEHFFKLREGVPGDGVCALYDNPKKNLRLYCIRYGSQIVVVGSGGHKPKNIRALQESDKLIEENYLLRLISFQITQKIKDRDILFFEGKEFSGELEFDI